MRLFRQTGSEEPSLSKIQSAPHERVIKESFLKYSRLGFTDAVVSHQFLSQGTCSPPAAGMARPQGQQLPKHHKLQSCCRSSSAIPSWEDEPQQDQLQTRASHPGWSGNSYGQRGVYHTELLTYRTEIMKNASGQNSGWIQQEMTFFNSCVLWFWSSLKNW